MASFTITINKNHVIFFLIGIVLMLGFVVGMNSVVTNAEERGVVAGQHNAVSVIMEVVEERGEIELGTGDEKMVLVREEKIVESQEELIGELIRISKQDGALEMEKDDEYVLLELVDGN